METVYGLWSVKRFSLGIKVKNNEIIFLSFSVHVGMFTETQMFFSKEEILFDEMCSH